MPDRPAVRLRALRAGDIPALTAALSGPLAATYPGGDRWLADRLGRGLASAAEVTVAVAGDGQVCGMLITQAKRRGMKLSCLWVAPAMRGRGVGRALLDRIVAAFGARPLYLTCDSTLRMAFSRLLAPAGFALAAALPGRYRPGADELVFTRVADPDAPIRALSLTRPWSELVLSAGKTVENRSRRTSHRGVLVIHGAQSTTDLAASFCPPRGLGSPPRGRDCPTGYLGFAHLVAVDCHDVGARTGERCDLSCSAWAMSGCWHWRLAAGVRFPEPIPGRGFVSLWTPPDDVLAAVRSALA